VFSFEQKPARAVGILNELNGQAGGCRQ
jgi:hypothetical protein